MVRAKDLRVRPSCFNRTTRVVDIGANEERKTTKHPVRPRTRKEPHGGTPMVRAHSHTHTRTHMHHVRAHTRSSVPADLLSAQSRHGYDSRTVYVSDVDDRYLLFGSVVINRYGRLAPPVRFDDDSIAVCRVLLLSYARRRSSFPTYCFLLREHDVRTQRETLSSRVDRIQPNFWPV